jgi:hypothetical protein
MDAMEAMLEVLLFTPTEDGWGAPAMFWGPPGVGKTKRLYGIAAKYGFPMQVLSPGLKGEGAFGVTPVPVGTDGALRLTYPRPAWTDEFEDAGCGLVLVDEITTAPPSLQPPLLGLVQEKRVGDHYLGDGVRVLGAGNPPAQAAAGYDLSMPLANRMGHYTWEKPGAMAWSQHMLSRPLPAFATDRKKRRAAVDLRGVDSMERRVAEGWAKAYAMTASSITSFIQRAPGHLHRMPEEGSPDSGRAWPSHRTHDLAMAVLTTAKIMGVDEIIASELYAGFVGRAVATEYEAFRSSLDLPDPEAVLNGTVAWKHDPRRLDRTMVVLSSCATWASNLPDGAARERNAVAAWELIATVADAKAQDLAVGAGRVMMKAGLMPAKANKAIVKIAPAMRAAGLMQGM